MDLHIHQTAVFYYKDDTPEVQPVVKKRSVPTVHAVIFLSLIHKMKHENFLINKCEIMDIINTKPKCCFANVPEVLFSYYYFHMKKKKTK